MWVLCKNLCCAQSDYMIPYFSHGRKLLLSSCRVVFDSLGPHGLQHARALCPLSSGVCSNSCALNLVMLYNHLILCCPLLLPSIFPSIGVFSNELALRVSWPKYWSFSLSIRHSNEYSGVISFRIDGFDLFAVQGTLKSLLQVALVRNTTLSFWLRNSPLTVAR